MNLLILSEIFLTFNVQSHYSVLIGVKFHCSHLQVALHDLKSDEKYEFHIGKRLSFSDENGDISVEMPAENNSHDFWPGELNI